MRRLHSNKIIYGWVIYIYIYESSNKGESGDKEQLKAVMKLKPWGGKDSDSIFSFKKYEDLNLNELQNKKNNLTQKTEDLNTDFYSRIQNLESWLDKNPTGITKAMVTTLQYYT